MVAMTRPSLILIRLFPVSLNRVAQYPNSDKGQELFWKVAILECKAKLTIGVIYFPNQGVSKLPDLPVLWILLVLFSYMCGTVSFVLSPFSEIQELWTIRYFCAHFSSLDMGQY